MFLIRLDVSISCDILESTSVLGGFDAVID